jgi:two-component system, chemotaxis family, chemotaxis protein CheY
MVNYKSITCLIVDDLTIMRRYLKNALQDMGFIKIIEAEDGKIAYEKLEKGRIDFIITDWLMHDMDGIELSRHVRTNPNTKDIPILMVTVKDKKKDVEDALQVGINDYIIKPFSIELLKKKINNIFEHLKIEEIISL